MNVDEQSVFDLRPSETDSSDLPVSRHSARGSRPGISPAVRAAGCALVGAGVLAAAISLGGIALDPGSLAAVASASDPGGSAGSAGSADSQSEESELSGPAGSSGSSGSSGSTGSWGGQHGDTGPAGGAGTAAGSAAGSGSPASVYVIRPGDSLARISGATGVPLDVLAHRNEIGDADLIYSGAALWLTDASRASRR